MKAKRVTIVGGGISGLALGIALRLRGAPVVVHEAGSYPRHRVCGEFINGLSGQTLRQLGISDLLQTAVPCRELRWSLRDRELLRARLPREALGISRYRLDDALARRFTGLGGELLEGSRLASPSFRNRAGYVWASGREQQRDSPWLGLKCHAQGLIMDVDLEMHLGRDGYVGLSRIEDSKINVCGLFVRRPSLRARRETLLLEYLTAAGLDTLRQRLTTAEVDPASCVGVHAFHMGESRLAQEKCLAIGDRRCIIEPFTGNGMGMALESAAVCAPVLERYAWGETAWEAAVEACRDAMRHRFDGRVKLSGSLHPFLYHPAGQAVAGVLARMRVLPFQTLFHLLFGRAG